MQRFSSGLINNRWAILTVTVLVCAANAPLVSLNQINDEYIKYFDKKTDFRASNDYIEKNLIGIHIMEYYFETGEADGVSRPHFLRQIDDFAN